MVLSPLAACGEVAVLIRCGAAAQFLLQRLTLAVNSRGAAIGGHAHGEMGGLTVASEAFGVAAVRVCAWLVDVGA